MCEYQQKNEQLTSAQIFSDHPLECIQKIQPPTFIPFTQFDGAMYMYILGESVFSVLNGPYLKRLLTSDQARVYHGFLFPRKPLWGKKKKKKNNADASFADPGRE